MSPWVNDSAGYGGRLRDHAGREVDAHGIDAVPGEKGADVSRAHPRSQTG